MQSSDTQPCDIPYLRTLRQRLLRRASEAIGTNQPSSPEDWGKFRTLYADLEQLPYTLQGVYDALLRLTKTQEALLERLDAEGKLEINTVYIIPEYDRNLFGFCLDSFIEVARRCQNASILYIGRTLRLSLPSSLREVASKLSSGKLTLPQELSQLIQHYWEDSGKRLRDYRDLSQHHLIIASDARAARDASHASYLYLALPNNPEVKKMRELRFADPAVHALPYAIEAYRCLYRYCFLLSAWLLAKTGTVSVDPISINLLPRVPFGAPGGEPILWIEPLRVSAGCWLQRKALEQEIADILIRGELTPMQSAP